MLGLRKSKDHIDSLHSRKLQPPPMGNNTDTYSRFGGGFFAFSKDGETAD